VPVIILNKVEFSQQILVKPTLQGFSRKPFLRAPDLPCGWVDGPTEGQKVGYNEANIPFSKLCGRSYKCVEQFVKCVEKGKFDTDVLALEHSDCYSLSLPLTLMKPASLHLHMAYLCFHDFHINPSVAVK
jgi:hypothetical protein